MTPKTRANVLVDKYTPYCTYNKEGLVIPVAKQCALIAVDEILDDKEDALDVMVDDEDINLTRTSMEYWQAVKHEINKL